MADLTRLLLRTGAKWRSVTTCEHHRWPWRGDARPCSGMMGTHCPVTSSQKHQHEKGKVGQEPDEREEHSAALAAEDREGSGAPVSSEQGEVGNAPLPWFGCSKGEVDEVREVVAELWIEFGRLRCDGDLTRPRGSVRR
jgi:hypothetical protein